LNGIWKYSHLLPFVSDNCKPTLGEGNTPLVRSKRIGRELGLPNLYFKLELINPTGSYKDRFAACAAAELLQHGQCFCLATSSGNTGAALAAYCAATGLKCFLAIVDGVPQGKLQQMRVYGAETIIVKDFGKVAEVTSGVFTGLRDLATKHDNMVQISAYHYSPFGMAGVQTIAYEIAETISCNDCHIFSPAGGGGLTLAIAKGFDVWNQSHGGFQKPKVHCVQPEGNDTIAGPLRSGAQQAVAVQNSTTSISGLQVPNVLDGNEVIAACSATGGTGFTVTDEIVYDCQRRMAVSEGIYCEPAGAVALAGVMKALENHEIDKEDTLVCLVTGHGFKDPSATAKMAERHGGRFLNSMTEMADFIEGKLARET
jgi:threonine synthase